MTKIQARVLIAMLASGKRLFTRDELMSLVGEFVSTRTLRGLQVAGFVGRDPGESTPWSLTLRGIAEAEALSLTISP